MSEEEDEKKHPNWMYIGPTNSKIGLKARTLVLGSQPPLQIRNLIELKPMISVLFVPTTRIDESRKNMARRGTIEYLAAEEVLKYTPERVVKELAERKVKQNKGKVI